MITAVAGEHQSFCLLSVLGFFIPPVALFMGLYFLASMDAVEKALGKHLLVTAICSTLFLGFVYLLLTYKHAYLLFNPG